MERPENPSKRAEEDKRLILAAQDGEEYAYQQLMLKYRKSVYYLVLKMIKNAEDAEDLTQESFTKAFSSLHSFDARFAFSTWLFRISTNTTIDFIRRKKLQTTSIHSGRENEDGSTNYLQIEDHNPHPDESYHKKQRKQYLQLAISRLPDRYRQLVELRYFEELSYEEIAQRLEVPIGTVKAQLHRSRELLNGELAAMEKNL